MSDSSDNSPANSQAQRRLAKFDHGFAGRLGKALDGRTQMWLAERTGLSRSTVNDYARGTIPSADRAFLLANVLNVDAEWLILGEGADFGWGPQHSNVFARTTEAGIVDFHADWRLLRESAFVRRQVAQAQEGDRWYFLSINPQWFVHDWRHYVVRALGAGARMFAATIDLPAMADSEVGRAYRAAFTWTHGIDAAIEGTELSLRGAAGIVADVSGRRAPDFSEGGTTEQLTIYRSIVPHPFLGLVVVPKDESRPGWALVSPYLLYPPVEYASNFGLVCSDVPGSTVYAGYRTSVLAYFERLHEKTVLVEKRRNAT